VAVEPLVVNRSPAPGSAGVEVDRPIRFGVRDENTRVDLSSLQIGLAYGSVLYEPANTSLLPEETPSFLETDASREVRLESFNDWAGPSHVDPADADASAGFLDMSMPSAGPLKSHYVMSEVLEDGDGFHVEFRPEVVAYTTAAVPYFEDPRFTGVMLGSVSGLRNRGVFLMLCDDAGTRRVVITGPAIGAGARQTLADVAYDWSLDTTYLVRWNEAPAVLQVEVYVRDEASGDVQRLAAIPFSSIDTFVGNAVFGGHEPATSTRAFAIFGVDGPVGNQAAHNSVRILPLAMSAVTAGVSWHGAEIALTPDDLVELPMNVDVAEADPPWATPEIEGTFTPSTTQLVIAQDSTQGLEECYIEREEPGLLPSPGWYLRARINAALTPSLTNHAGAAIEVCDGERQAHLGLITDFATPYFGLRLDNGVSPEQEAGYEPATGDWTTSRELLFISDGEAGVVDVYVDDDLVPAASVGRGDLPASALAHVRAGHIRPGLTQRTYGTFRIESLKYSCDLVRYEASSGALPPIAAWTLDATGPGSEAMVGDAAVFTDTGYGTAGSAGWRRYIRSLPDLQPEHGVFVEAIFSISAWSDTVGSPNPTEEPIAGGFSIDDMSDLVRLMATQTAAGAKYVYLQGADAASTLEAVLLQTEEGEAISAAVDWTEAHTYRLERRPGSYVRLYVDNADTPIIDVQWSDIDLPNGAETLVPSVVVGSSDTTRQCTSSWKAVRIGTSRGYDLSVRRSLSQEEMDEHAFDGHLNLVVEVADTDP